MTAQSSELREVYGQRPAWRYLDRMDAMIFAAGLGTRLQPLTNTRPKALVEVDGVPIIEIVARRLVGAGADRLIINTHPFPELIRELVHSRNGFGAEVLFSHEPDGPLDTGGGLRRAATLFCRDAPFFLHNCDVISDIDLRALYRTHAASDGAIATLAVLPHSAQRYLVFDDRGLCGYSPRGGGDDVVVRPLTGVAKFRDFTGIHVASPALLQDLPDVDVFSIITLYLQLSKHDARVAMFEQPGAHWIDIGSHDQLAAANRFAAVNRLAADQPIRDR